MNALKCYLENTTQCVKISGKLIHKEKIQYRIPKGTVLGPVIFSVCMNGLLFEPNQEIVSFFADDTIVICKDETYKETKQWQNEIIAVTKFDEIPLMINSEKIKYIALGCNKSKILPFNNLYIVEDDMIIGKADQVKYLGVEIYHILKWNIHIRQLIKKLRSLILNSDN